MGVKISKKHEKFREVAEGAGQPPPIGNIKILKDQTRSLCWRNSSRDQALVQGHLKTSRHFVGG